MKFVVILDPETFKTDTFRYDEPGQVPPIIIPPDKDEAKDGGVTGPDEENPKKPKPS